MPVQFEKTEMTISEAAYNYSCNIPRWRSRPFQVRISPVLKIVFKPLILPRPVTFTKGESGSDLQNKRRLITAVKTKKHLPNSGITHKTSGMYIIFSSYQRVFRCISYDTHTSGILSTCQSCGPDCIFHQTIVLVKENNIFLI